MLPAIRPNRLATEPSPYLRQHATNPVEWYPWGAEALERARKENRPVLLSVGYSACHWCHVMAHESFEDPETAAVMNAHFVNVKVDREERPDVDQLYQGVVQLMGRGGGWPLTVFLTPTLHPMYGGTYFPKDSRYGLPGFRDLLTHVARGWESQRAELEEQSHQFVSGLKELALSGLEGQPSGLATGDVADCARRLWGALDRVHGGFGSGGPKFPNPSALAVLFRGYRRTTTAALRDGALFTLEKMARSGVRDQLGGGFHRYAVDGRWQVPHFEKMLYDNALLLHLYSEAMQLAPRPLWRTVAEETVAWLTREMVSPEGGFYSAQDADSDGEEGKYFVWREDELDSLLGGTARLVKRHFGTSPQGNFESTGANVLQLARDEEELAKEWNRPVEAIRHELTEAKAALFAERARRVAPGLDDKVLAGWNGLMMRGLALASRVFHRPDWTSLAVRAGEFALSHFLRSDGSLWRSFQGTGRLPGMLEDYGGLASGFLSLYQTTFDPRWLEAAERLVDAAVPRFWDDQQTAWRTAPKAQDDLVVTCYALHDHAAPSGASTLTEAQIFLAALTGKPRHLELPQRYLQRLREAVRENPFAFGHLIQAMDCSLDGARELTIVGAPHRTAPFLELMARRFEPTTALHCVDPQAPVPEVAAEVLTHRSPGAAQVSAFLCANYSCAPAVSEVGALNALLDRHQEPARGAL